MAEISEKAKKASTIDQNQRALPEELQEVILTYVPANSLCKFRCVCTQWLSLTHHPSFIARHNRHSPPSFLSRRPLPNGTLLLYRLSGNRLIQPRTKPLVFRRPVGYSSLSNSLHGLVSGYDTRCTYLLNPATRDLAILPRLPGPTDPYHLALAFDPSARNYSLVTLHPHPKSSLWSCSTLTIGTDTEWRRVRDALSLQPRGEPVFTNRAVHWVVLHPVHRAAVLAVDVVNNGFRIIPPPEPATVLEMVVHEFEGCLAVSVHERCTPRMTIWVMREYCAGEEWTKECVVDLSAIGDGFIIPPRFVGVEGGRLLIQCCVRGSVYAYDPCSGSLELCCETARRGLVFYKESLLSPRRLVRGGGESG